MRRFLTILLTALLGSGSWGCSAGARSGGDQAAERLAELKGLREKLKPLQRKLPAPGPDDWLASHEEPGQTLEQYLLARPVRATGARRVIYIQPIGSFSKEHQRILALTAECLGLYFGLPVKTLPVREVDEEWPEDAQRIHPSWGDHQLLTTYILDEVLRPRLPKDAAVLLGLTTMDLWPGRGWNFVFGQASLRQRVGVWSLHRNGDPALSEASFRRCLRRTLKTATHETGHMFSMRHCIAFECNMCGWNNRAESDRHPLSLCAECLPKLCHATGVKPRPRFAALEAFCRKNGLADEARRFDKSRHALTP